MTLSPDLKEFIISFCREFNIKHIDIEALNLETSIDMDLDLYDIIFDFFLNDFGERFKIDITKLKWGDKLLSVTNNAQFSVNRNPQFR